MQGDPTPLPSQHNDGLALNVPFAEWGKIFDSTTVATAITDRLVYNSEIIILEGSKRWCRRSKGTLRPNDVSDPFYPTILANFCTGGNSQNLFTFKPLNADFMEKYCQKPEDNDHGRPDKTIYDHWSHMVLYLAVMAALKVAFSAIYSNKSNNG